jgi:hypothetical protein
LYYRDADDRKIIIVPENQMRNFIAVAGNEKEKIVYLSNEDVNLQKVVKVRITGGLFAAVEGASHANGGASRAVEGASSAVRGASHVVDGASRAVGGASSANGKLSSVNDRFFIKKIKSQNVLLNYPCC